MLDLFWQIFLPGQMTRIQEPDLLIDHDSGGSGCKRFLGGPVVEPFAFSGVSHIANDCAPNKIKSGGLSGKWFPFSSHPSPKKPSRTKKEADAISFSLTSSSSTSPAPTEENPVIVVHNNNNNIILDMLDENTRWSSSTAHPSTILPPPAVVPSSNHSGLLSSTTKTSRNNHNSVNNSSNKSHSKPTKHGKNNNSNNHINNSNNKNNCNNSISSNNSSSSSINNKTTTNSRINNCGPTSVTTTTGSHISSSGNHYHSNGISDDEDAGARHLIIRYIHCNERPNKKQLVTLGLISVIFLIILVILLALFLGPTSTRSLGESSSKNSKDSNNNYNNNQFSDTLISSDIASSLNNDDVDLDDSESYDDGDTPYYSSTTSSTGIDLKKVSKLSWDLLNSNQDASSRGGSGSGGGGGRGASLSSLGSVRSGGDGEIILPAKMIYTSSGDSADLIPSEHGGSQNKKRSCCRTQKYSQVIKRDGCEPLTIVNKMCFGQCVSVWVPGLFQSFPVCRPSKSTFKTVTLTCGRNREKRKRVRIEKVRRCSCMEIEPTAASL